jgi:anti-sigma regulatory factor (Ser/Thr protein kinase)
MRPSLTVEVREQTGVGEARRAAADLGRSLALSETRLSDLAIVVTELASNLVKHTPDGGTLLLRPGPAGGVEVLTLDRGPGIPRVGEVLRDGYSTSGTPGTGLGAVSRLSDAFDLHTTTGVGSVVYASIGERTLGSDTRAPDLAFDVGAVQRNYPGEPVCGDDWVYTAGQSVLRVSVIDGLGHGLHAHEAARSAVRSTRGAVGAVVALDTAAGRLQFAGVGNLTGAVLGPTGRRGLLSHNGTLGQEVRKVQEQELPWSGESVLVLHTDGLSGSWDLSGLPGLLRRRAAVIAGVLYRDHARGRDDATVVVVKAAG